MCQLFRSILVLILISTFQYQLRADPTGYKPEQTVSFSFAAHGKTAPVWLDKDDFRVVSIAAEIFANDVFGITGNKPVVETELPVQGDFVILAGTLGRNKWIDQLADKGSIDGSVRNQWETYTIQVVKSPFKGIKNLLVVAGSDRRGTAYGILELSRLIGVSPWEWWADVTPAKRQQLILPVPKMTSKPPSVKFRGIFINDEDWGIQPWAAKTFEPETGDIGPKTYARIFELLLRLRANTIWPAMHGCTKPFYFYQDNKKVADDYAIVIGTSHCEPLLCNINGEWNRNEMGEFRYDNNADAVRKLFQKRLDETAGKEGIYTVGIRGEHDSPMIGGGDSIQDKVKLLNKVIADERQMLSRSAGRPADKIPQIFIPYKEVLTFYQNGLEVPEDISLVWTDDNYGYIRQLSNPAEQKRPGGSGIYYHTSYWGRPHDYLWLNTTSPSLIWEEMSKAWQFNARNLWILNCGDIKPHEYNIELFLDMAWNLDEFRECKNVREHMSNWYAREFGKVEAGKITGLMVAYYRLAFSRRPEFMAWSQTEPTTKPGKTELTQVNCGDEIAERLLTYDSLVDQVEKIKKAIPEYRKDAFYELVYYPVIGAASMNRKWLNAYKSEFAAKQGRSSAGDYAKASDDAYQRIVKETIYYNTGLQKGKWNHMMNEAPRDLPVYSPTVSSVPAKQAKAGFGLSVEGIEPSASGTSLTAALPVFNKFTNNRYFIDLFMKGSGSVKWIAIPQADWIKLSEAGGEFSDAGKHEQRLWITIDWNKLPKPRTGFDLIWNTGAQTILEKSFIKSALRFASADTTIAVDVLAFNPETEDLKNFRGFIEDNGCISMIAADFSRSIPGKEAKWHQLGGLGYHGTVMGALPYSAHSNPLIADMVSNSPRLEYNFFSFSSGDARVKMQAIPTHPFCTGRGVRCAVSIDDSEPVLLDFQTFERSEEWKQNVLRNAAYKEVPQFIDKPGKHTLKLWMADPGVMIDNLLIDFGGRRSSYAFPPETRNGLYK